MNVLSLFDGMSCGQQALKRIDIKVDKYYASEIDKYAISITQKNYPSTIQLESVVNVDVTKLERIDLLIGGSPCQSFSFAGKRKGMSTKDEIEILTLNQYLELKEQNFEFEGQSYLFWEYMRILIDIRKTNPDVKFLLENVMMGEKWEKVLSKAIGVNAIEFNSSLVSAQNRRRLYWTNIGMKPAGLFGDLESIIVQPKDKGILLKDILQSEVDEKYFLSEKMIASFQKHDGKTYCLDTGNTNAVEIVAMDFRTDEGLRIRNEGKTPTLCINTPVYTNTPRIRRLTPTECERLQTVKDGYTDGVSDTQRYRMLGNGWTVDVIAHILNYLK
jgi:DNA (cytosine-5)-methyltransferase 3A